MARHVKLFLFIVFVLFFVGVLVYFGFYWSDSGGDGVIRENNGEIGIGEEVEEIEEEEEFEEVDGLEDSGSGSGGSGEGRGAGSSGNVIFSGECAEQQISYSLKDFLELETCDILEGNVCIDKIVNCSLVVENLDYQVGGNFEIEFSFIGDGWKKLNSFFGEIFLGPRIDQRLEKVFNIQGEDADKHIECIFITTKVPMKEVCV